MNHKKEILNLWTDPQTIYNDAKEYYCRSEHMDDDVPEWVNETGLPNRLEIKTYLKFRNGN